MIESQYFYCVSETFSLSLTVFISPFPIITVGISQGLNLNFYRSDDLLGSFHFHNSPFFRVLVRPAGVVIFRISPKTVYLSSTSKFI